MIRKVRIEHQCKECVGTGLYKGFAEQDGAAVVCHGCNGTGKAVFEEDFTLFTGRQPMKGVKQVFQVNPGIGIGVGAKVVDDATGKALKLEDFGGISHKDWEAGKSFGRGTEMRRYTCPAWWYQSADYKKKPDWKECRGWAGFSKCPSFKAKDKCWERFDTEQDKKGKK